MIKNTFSILPGIGEKLERRLWKNGVLSWEDFIAAGSIDFLSNDRKITYNNCLQEALQNLNDSRSTYLSKTLKHSDHWRLFQAFRDKAVALDIETDGKPVNHGGSVTVVGLYDGFDYRSLVRGKNLTGKRLAQELTQYDYIITFYGSVFDLPCLHETFNLTIQVPHFDLCFSGRKTGLRGGLKKVEETLGIYRDASVKGFDGFDAVRLWNEAQNGSDEAMELLLTYNRCDTVNLFSLAEIIFERLVAQTGIASYIVQR
jgi:uncharacterized protein YprB with RNaseH-like and TPR domain